jgi:thioesterase domain-containing protein
LTETNVVRRLFISHDTVIESARVPVGYPVDDMEVEIQDEQGRRVPPDQPGEIVIKSRYLAPGYWNQPELTRASFQDDPDDASRRIFRTRDVGLLRPDGCLIHLGRKDEQVKIRGLRIEVAEIEAALLCLERFAEAAVIPVPDVQGELRLVAYLTPRSTTGSPVQVAEIRERLVRILPDPMIPSTFILCPELPRTGTGKVDRAELGEREVDWTVSRSGGSSEEPRTATECVLLELFEQVLGLRRAGLEDTFEQLGGTSLQALELARLVETILAKVVPWHQLAGGGTIRDLAATLDSLPPASRLTALAPPTASPGRPGFFCVPGVLYGVELLRQLARGLSPRWDCYGLEYGIQPKIDPLVQLLIREMKQVQPSGPYHLGGHSFGGWIAYEAACRLSDAGERVGLLLFFDTYGPGFPRPVTSWLECQVRGWRRLWAMPRRARIDWILEQIRLLRRTVGNQAGAETPKRRLDEAWDLVSKQIRPERVAYLEHLEPFRGPAVLLRASVQPESLHLSCSDRFNGLKAFAPGGLRVFDVPGDHRTMVDAPEFVSIIGGLMEACSSGPGSVT